MDQTVLVAYATKYDATREIAEAIGATLREHGLQAEVRPAEEVADLAGYGAVVLGSAVYAGQWRKEAADLLQAQEAALAARPVWLFSSGPTGEGDPVGLLKGWRFPEALAPLAERVGARDRALFHGDIREDKLNFAEKLIVKGVKAPMGDFRDWEAIRAWARGVAEALKAEA